MSNNIKLDIWRLYKAIHIVVNLVWDDLSLKIHLLAQLSTKVQIASDSGNLKALVNTTQVHDQMN